MKERFETLKDICRNFSIPQVARRFLAIEKVLSQNNKLGIAVIGQFKAGKSSFINSVLGKNILPVGAIPVTAIVTTIEYGTQDRAIVKFNDGKAIQVNFDHLGEYISETLNPKNTKNVSVVSIYTPTMANLQNLCFYDTPGLGSIFENNTRETERFLPEVNLALILINSQNPLSENDMKIIKEIYTHTSETSFILTKTDLLSDKDLQEIINYIRSNLKDKLGINPEIYPYSIHQKDTRKTILEKILLPANSRANNLLNTAAEYKISVLGEQCIKYLKIKSAYLEKLLDGNDSLKTDLLQKQKSLDRFSHNLGIYFKNFIYRKRNEISDYLLGYEKQITSRLQKDFRRQKEEFKGNFQKINEDFSRWIKEEIREEISGKLAQSKFLNEIINEYLDYLSESVNDFMQKLAVKIRQSLGVELPLEKWEVDKINIPQPNIHIYSAFDFKADIIWLLVPTFLIKSYVLNHLEKQIPAEVNKNLYRTVSILTNFIERTLNQYNKTALDYIEKQLNDIDELLSENVKEKEAIDKAIAKLQTIEANSNK